LSPIAKFAVIYILKFFVIMLNRRHIRVKVMQTIYAFKGGESDDFSNNQKFLLYSIDNMYNLYLLMISILIEVNNELLKKLRENFSLEDDLDRYQVKNWELDQEYIDIIFKEITSSDLYGEYMQTRVSDFKQDKNFIVDVFKDIIAPNEKLYDYIEDKNLTWLDDLPTVNTTILKLLRKVKATSIDSYFTPKLYKDTDDKQFAIDLFKKTLLNRTALNNEIEQKTKNWDADRIANVDYVLLQMGICELKNFSSIPVKVSINEYLEIAKEYSTPKSSVFINGILDKLSKEYEAEGTLNKIGRGLM